MADELKTPPIALAYDALLSQIQQLCTSQLRRGPETDRAILSGILDIAASRFDHVVEETNAVVDQAFELDEARAAIVALTDQLKRIQNELMSESFKDGSFREKVAHEIDLVLKPDAINFVLVEQDANRDRLLHLETLIGNPEIVNFIEGVKIEAAHQKERWGAGHDQNKRVEDWICLFTYLLGKLTQANWDRNGTKLLHHLVTLGAVAGNAHAQIIKAAGLKQAPYSAENPPSPEAPGWPDVTPS